MIRGAGAFSSVNVSWFSGGSSVPSTGYSPFQGIVFFAPGQTIANITITILANSIPEPNKTIIIYLTNAIGNFAGQASISGTPSNVTLLASNDWQGLFGFSSVTPVSVSVPSNGLPYQLKVVRAQGNYTQVNIRWTIQVSNTTPDILILPRIF